MVLSTKYFKIKKQLAAFRINVSNLKFLEMLQSYDKAT